MTEKDKMLRQLMYDANYDQELIAERQQAKELCYDYNHLRPSDEASQRTLMQRLLGSSKKAFCILAPFWCDYGYNIEIGENFFANHNTVILDAAKVTFGDNVFIAPTAASTLRVTPSTPSAATKASSMPTPSPWATMYG